LYTSRRPSAFVLIHTQRGGHSSWKKRSQQRIRKFESEKQGDDVDAIKRVLAKAYDTEPFVNWFVLQDVKRLQRIEMFFELSIKNYAMEYKHVFITEELNGVAAWYPPEPRDSWKSSTLKD
jgi:hypothetical protein